MSDWEKYLDKIYANPRHPGSFSGPEKLYQAVKNEGKFRIGRSRIRKWLQGNSTYTFNRIAHKVFARNHVVVAGIDALWDSDLFDFSYYTKKNNGYRYVLLAIDVFSRYVWLRPLESKASGKMIPAFKSILNEGRHPISLRTDKGSEYTNVVIGKFFTENNIHHYCTHNEKQANYAERAIKTIKTKIYRYMREHNTHKYIDVLQSFVHAYNNSLHRSIGTTPASVNTVNEDEIRLKEYQLKHRKVTAVHKVKSESNVKSEIKEVKKKKPKAIFRLKIGDTVRISMLKEKFDREYDQKWSTETFIISTRFRRENLVLYKLKDMEGDPLEGSFYSREVQKVTVGENDEHIVEKIVKKKAGKAFVKWKGWPRKFNSWIPVSQIKNL